MQERQEFVEIIDAREPQSKKFKGLGTGWLLSVAMIGLVIGGLVGGLLGAFLPLPGGFFIGAQVGVVLGASLGFGIGLAACCITNLFSKQSKGYNVLGLGTGTTMIGLVIGSFLGSFILPGVGNIVGSLVGAAIGLGVTLVPACLTYIGTELVAYFGKPNDGDIPNDKGLTQKPPLFKPTVEELYGKKNNRQNLDQDQVNYPNPLLNNHTSYKDGSSNDMGLDNNPFKGVMFKVGTIENESQNLHQEPGNHASPLLQTDNNYESNNTAINNSITNSF